MANQISMEDFLMAVPTESGERLRDEAERLGKMLLWHAENTPAGTWATIAESGLRPQRSWTSDLLHRLYKHRPKREPTAEELHRIMELLRGHVMTEEVFANVIADPEWTLFSLSLLHGVNRERELEVI